MMVRLFRINFPPFGGRTYIDCGRADLYVTQLVVLRERRKIAGRRIGGFAESSICAFRDGRLAVGDEE